MEPYLDFNFVLSSLFSSVGQVYNLSSASARIIDVALPSINPGFVEIIKTLSLLFSLVLLAGIVWVLSRTAMLGKPVPSPVIAEVLTEAPPKPAAEGPWVARWNEVLRHMDSAKETEWKFALIEADALVDRVLAKAGFAGDTLGERLMNIQPGQLTTIEQLWAAHKVRNRVAHQPDYFLRFSEARQAIGWYELTLRELAAL